MISLTMQSSYVYLCFFHAICCIFALNYVSEVLCKGAKTEKRKIEPLSSLRIYNNFQIYNDCYSASAARAFASKIGVSTDNAVLYLE